MNRRCYRLPKTEREAIVAAYSEGRPGRTVAQQWDVSHQVVYNLVREAGEVVRSRKYRSSEPFRPAA